MTLHAIDDPTAFVEHESAYRATREGAGTDDLLVQAFTRESEHSSLSDSGYASVLAALATWVETGDEPTPAGVAASCPALRRTLRHRLLPRPGLHARHRTPRGSSPARAACGGRP